MTKTFGKENISHTIAKNPTEYGLVKRTPSGGESNPHQERKKMSKTIEFTIEVPPRSKKNNQQIVMNHKTKRLMVLPSKAYREYEGAVAEWIPYLQIDKPINIKAIFYMDARRKVDLVNLEEALLDVLVKHGCIKDDNSKIVVSMDGSRVDYDKYFPRTYVVIEEIKDE